MKQHFQIAIMLILISCSSSQKRDSILVDPYPWRADAGEAVGTITSVDCCWLGTYHYVVNNKVYTGYDLGGRDADIRMGEKYLIFYNPKNPNERIADTRRPVIDFDLSRHRFSKATITNVKIIGYRYDSSSIIIRVVYDYDRLSQSGKTKHSLGIDSFVNQKSETTLENIKVLEGKTFRVVYDIRNHSVAILLLDEPLSADYDVDPYGKDRKSIRPKGRKERFVQRSVL